MNRPTFGPAQQTLDHPATTRWLAQMDREEEIAIASSNEAIVVAHAERVLRGETRYFVQRKVDGFYFAADFGPRFGPVFVSNRDVAKPFDGYSLAECQIATFTGSASEFAVVQVQG